LLKNFVHKGVNFEAQNALKLTFEHTSKGGGEGRGEGGEKEGTREGRPPIHIPGYATAPSTGTPNAGIQVTSFTASTNGDG